ncbi:MAG: Beta-lactamase [Verrucomicrobiales bacterium]|nr:Beta-lactamase [Verrucomicrobiales bacterium]
MHDDALKKLWQEQRFDASRSLPDEKEIAAMKRKMKKFDRTISWRDGRESLAAIFIIIWFGRAFFKVPAPLAKVGCVILVLASVFICWYPIRKKRRVAKAAPDAPMTQALQCELEKVEVQIRLLRSIVWWYLLPLMAGALVFHFGMQPSLSSNIGYSAFVVALSVFIYWLNQRAVEKQLLPLQRELEATLLFDEPIARPEPTKKTMITKTMLLGIVLMLIGAVVFLRGRETTPPTVAYADPISQMLETIRVKHKFPALAVAVVVDGKIVMTNAVGLRKLGGTEAVTVNDKFHLGSVTKSMTATVAAMLVEQGKISWTTTIGESFPELGGKLHPDYRGVTLEQLLAHRGGAPGQAPSDLWRKAWTASGTPGEQRLDFVKGLLGRSPEAKPGTKHIYSNQGYSIAGVMLERAGGKLWEELMRTMLFEPLGMESAGFGAPATPGNVDQPWGHKKGPFTGIEAVPPGPRADNPAAIGPAGTVHCSLADLAAYAAFHMVGERGGSKLLKADSFKKLHTSAGDDYALGWVVLKRPWAGGRALMHNGSNTMFYVVVWMAPDLNSAVIVATNVGVDAAFGGCDEAASQLIQQFFPK